MGGRRRGLLFRAANIAGKHRREDLHVKHVEIAYSFASVQPTPSAPVQLSGHALMTFDKLDASTWRFRRAKASLRHVLRRDR